MLHFLLLICPYDLTRATHKFSNRLFAAVPFQFLKLKSGTVCQRPSSDISSHHHCRLTVVV